MVTKMNKKTYKNENKMVDEEEDDNDSLGSALSDYNGIFYDAQSINEEFKPLKHLQLDERDEENSCDSNENYNNRKKEIVKKLNIDGGSIDSSFDDNDNKTDEDIELLSIEDDSNIPVQLKNSDDFNNHSSNNKQLQHEKTLISNEMIEEVVKDDDIDAEFENYLNDDSDDEEESNNIDEFRSKKLQQLSELDYDNLDNIELIKQLAIDKYGFIKKKFRRKAWRLLILNQSKNVNNGSDEFNASLEKFNNISEEQIKSNRYYNQVTLDVIRTLKRFPPEISDKLRLKLQNKLIDLICKILVKHDNLHYYQGYHDICLTFLLVTGVDNSLPLLENLTLTHLTPYMETTMETTLKLLFNIMPLIDKINFQVAEHIQKAELGVIFCISWLITWYSHVMDNLQIILRLYDFFIATHPLMPIYLGAIIVSDKSSEILDIDCDMASLHTVITKYPSKIEDMDLLEGYIKRTLELFEKYPPNTLSVLNDKWLEKCKQIELKMLEEKRQQEEMMLRQRKNKRTNNNNYNNDDNESNSKVARRNLKTSLMRFNNNKKGSSGGQKIANKFLVGLTFTVGVAAVAMYAINSNASQPQDILSKFYHLLSYKDF